MVKRTNEVKVNSLSLSLYQEEEEEEVKFILFHCNDVSLGEPKRDAAFLSSALQAKLPKT